MRVWKLLEKEKSLPKNQVYWSQIYLNHDILTTSLNTIEKRILFSILNTYIKTN